ncbi:MAG: hypothetical protein M1823_003445 [Watsoniomyces obsoletus]|nr:MAG: hypothetical protein M1823_003445 [Watsoniomyces obsoletus]
MADWRIRGYVEDSEASGEDEEVNGSVQPLQELVEEADRELHVKTGPTEGGGFYSIDDFNDLLFGSRRGKRRFLKVQINRSSDEGGGKKAENQRHPSTTSAEIPTGIQDSDAAWLPGRSGHRNNIVYGVSRKPRSGQNSASGTQTHEHIRPDVLESASSTEQTPIATPVRPLASTPLTSISRPQFSSPRRAGKSVTPLPTASITLSAPNQLPPPSTRSEEPDLLGSNDLGRPVRSLRKRNPIQLHPYLLEGERYRQILKARGVKPVKIQTNEDRNAEESQFNGEADTEPDSEGDFQMLDQDESSSTASPSPSLVRHIEEESSPPRAAGILEDDERFEEDDSQPVDLTNDVEEALAESPSSSDGETGDVEDFPDLDSLLFHRPSTGFRRTGFKRQRLNQREPLSHISGNELDVGTQEQPPKPKQVARPARPPRTQQRSTPRVGSPRKQTVTGPTRLRPPHAPKKTRPAKKGLAHSRQPVLEQLWQATSRPAQLESTRTRYREKRPKSRGTLENRLAEIEREYQTHLLQHPEKAKVPLSRFLRRGESAIPPPLEDDSLASENDEDEDQATQVPIRKEPKRRVIRRRSHQPVDDSPMELRSPTVDLTPGIGSAGMPTPISTNDGFPTFNLAGFGPSFTLDFDTVPLELGTFFHDSTFIGSGDFDSVCRADYSCKPEHRHGLSTVRVGSEIHRWRIWNETVSTEFGRSMDWACDRIKSLPTSSDDLETATASQELTTYLQSLIRYLTNGLVFGDPIDRLSFVQRSSHLLEEFQESIASSWGVLSRGPDIPQSHRKAFIQTSTLMLVLSFQIYKMAAYEGRPVDASITELLRSTSLQLLSHLHLGDLSRVRNFYLDNRQPKTGEQGIRQDGYILEGIVVAMHVLENLNIPSLMFWELVHLLLMGPDMGDASDVRSHERIWSSLFALLPLHEFDQRGILRVGRRFHEPRDGWALARPLTNRLLSLYRSTPAGKSSILNSYCRTILSRCHRLIVQWGWRKCDGIIGTIFDFFASNGLAHLRYEESHGSVRFLEDLDGVPDLSVNSGDRSFHIFLKILAVGLRGLASIYPESKIRNIVFRLMPNHGRQYPKEQPVQPEDLDALRNHHDLLATLYWVSPASCRPSFNIIRDLVDAETSHREACQVNIRAWLNLARYQLSTTESTTPLQALGAWHAVVTSKALKQHELVKTQTETQYGARQSIEGFALVDGMLKMTIEANQRQVEVIISDALRAMHSAMRWCKYEEAATALLSKASTADVFNLFEARKRHTEQVVIQSLEIVKEYVSKCTTLSSAHASQQPSDDSQDFGDWSAFIEADRATRMKEAAEHLQNTVYDGLARLLSNAFGAEVQPEDSILTEIVDAWIGTAKMLVNSSLKQWDDFVGAYSRHSWSTLWTTEQTRKYTAYFMARVIEADSESYHSQRSLFLSQWMACLVERESMLKFQHLFTNTLLNTDRDNPLLKNLPFWFRIRDATYSITLTEFSERRLSLISSVLTNMRESLENISNNRQETIIRREEYTLLLKRLMSAMKSNYLELQQTNVVAGSYVEFVQKVVTYLQQYTVDISPVDRFFTDSALFPLPATDPTYVVGRLKNYELKLSSTAAVQKQLASFIQSVSIRAAIDDQQEYLSMQLTDAMTSAFEDSTQESPSLRAFLMKAIIPTYLAHAFAAAAGAGWVLARPILEASRAMFEDLLQRFDGMNSMSIDSVESILDEFWDASCRAVLGVLDNPRLLEKANMLHILGMLIRTLTASLQITEYIHRGSYGERGRRAIVNVGFWYRFIKFIKAFLEKEEVVISPLRSPTSDHFSSLDATIAREHPSRNEQGEERGSYSEVKIFCAKELQESLQKNWTVVHRQPTHDVGGGDVIERQNEEEENEKEYYFHRGSTQRRKVNIKGFLKSWEDEKRGVIKTGVEFLGAWEGLDMEFDEFEVDEEGMQTMRTRRERRKRRVLSRQRKGREGWLS